MNKKTVYILVAIIMLMVTSGAGKQTAPVPSFAGTASQVPNGTGLLFPGSFPDGQVLDGQFFTNVHMPSAGIVQFLDIGTGQFVLTRNIPLLNISGTVVLKTPTENHVGILRIYNRSDHALVWVHELYAGNSYIGTFHFTVPFFALGNATSFYFTISVAQDLEYANPAMVMLTFSP